MLNLKLDKVIFTLFLVLFITGCFNQRQILLGAPIVSSLVINSSNPTRNDTNTYFDIIPTTNDECIYNQSWWSCPNCVTGNKNTTFLWDANLATPTNIIDGSVMTMTNFISYDGGFGLAGASSANDPEIRTGKYGNGLTCDGNNDYLNSSMIDFTNKSFTVMVWMNISNETAAAARPYIIATGDTDFTASPTGVQPGWALGGRFSYGTPVDIFWSTRNGLNGGMTRAIGTGSRVNDSKWHFYAVSNQFGIVNQTNVILDGNILDSSTFSTILNISSSASTNWISVCNQNYPVRYIYVNKTIDNLAIYMCALTSSQINRSMNSSLPIDFTSEGGCAPTLFYGFENNNATHTLDTHQIVNPNMDGVMNSKGGAWIFGNVSNNNIQYISYGTNIIVRNYTLSFDFKSNMNTNTPGLLGKIGEFRAIIQSNKLRFDVYNKTTVIPDTISSSSNINTGTWYHADLTFNNVTNNMTLYLNGVSEASKITLITPNYQNSEFEVGRRDTTVPFNGTIDNVQLVNYVKSVYAINQSYQEWLTNSTTRKLLAEDTTIGDTWQASYVCSNTTAYSTLATANVNILPYPITITSPLNNTDNLFDPYTQIYYINHTFENATNLTSISTNLDGDISDIYAKTIFWLAFDNVTALGENDTKIKDIGPNRKYNFTITGTGYVNETKNRGAIYFKGDNTQGVASSDTPIHYKDNSTLSVSFWGRFDKNSTNGHGYFLADAGQNQNVGYVAYRIPAGTEINIYWEYANTTQLYGTATVMSFTWNLGDRVWHHYVFVADYNKDMLTMYRDGDLWSNISIPNAVTLRNDRTWYLGKYNQVYTSNNFTGAFDDVMAIDGILNPNEVKRLYASRLYKYSPSDYIYELGVKNISNGIHSYSITTTSLFQNSLGITFTTLPVLKIKPDNIYNSTYTNFSMVINNTGNCVGGNTTEWRKNQTFYSWDFNIINKANVKEMGGSDKNATCAASCGNINAAGGRFSSGLTTWTNGTTNSTTYVIPMNLTYTTQFCMGAWVKVAPGINGGGIISTRGQYQGILVNVNANQNVSFWSALTGMNFTLAGQVFTNSFMNNTKDGGSSWQFVVSTYNTTDLSIWLNGTKQSSVSASIGSLGGFINYTNWAGDYNTWIGKQRGSNNEAFNGSIDYAFIKFNESCSQSEIFEMFNSSLNNIAPKLLAQNIQPGQNWTATWSCSNTTDYFTYTDQVHIDAGGINYLNIISDYPLRNDTDTNFTMNFFSPLAECSGGNTSIWQSNTRGKVHYWDFSLNSTTQVDLGDGTINLTCSVPYCGSLKYNASCTMFNSSCYIMNQTSKFEKTGSGLNLSKHDFSYCFSYNNNRAETPDYYSLFGLSDSNFGANRSQVNVYHNRLSMRWDTILTTNQVISSDATMPLFDNLTHHFCVSYTLNNSKASIYSDGTLNYNVTILGYPMLNSTSVIVANAGSQPGGGWNGTIDDISLYEYALTPIEVAEIRNISITKRLQRLLPNMTAAGDYWTATVACSNTTNYLINRATQYIETSCTSTNWLCSEMCMVGNIDVNRQTIYATGPGRVTVTGNVTDCNTGSDLLVVRNSCDVTLNGGKLC